MSRSVSRRDFSKRLATLAVLPAVPAVADVPPATVTPSPAPVASGPTTTAAAAGPSQDALALAQVVNNRWGDRLSAEELGEVIQSIDRGLQRAAELYRLPLSNADAPDFAFTPYRGG